MFRTYQQTLDVNGYALIEFSPDVVSVEWDIYQISVQTTQQTPNCHVTISHNGFFLCGSFQGWQDTAVGPPDVVLLPNDKLRVAFMSGNPGDEATIGVWFNENPTGTTYSTSH